MEYCKEGLRLVQEASHENIVEYNVNIKIKITNYFKLLQKPLVDAIITKINDDIDKITALNNENDEENRPKIFYLADRASTNKRCLFAYL